MRQIKSKIWKRSLNLVYFIIAAGLKVNMYRAENSGQLLRVDEGVPGKDGIELKRFAGKL